MVKLVNSNRGGVPDCRTPKRAQMNRAIMISMRINHGRGIFQASPTQSAAPTLLVWSALRVGSCSAPPPPAASLNPQPRCCSPQSLPLCCGHRVLCQSCSARLGRSSKRPPTCGEKKISEDRQVSEMCPPKESTVHSGSGPQRWVTEANAIEMAINGLSAMQTSAQRPLKEHTLGLGATHSV